MYALNELDEWHVGGKSGKVVFLSDKKTFLRKITEERTVDTKPKQPNYTDPLSTPVPLYHNTVVIVMYNDSFRKGTYLIWSRPI